METVIYESAKSTYVVFKTSQKDQVCEYADHLLPLYVIKKKVFLSDKKNSSHESNDCLCTGKSILQHEERRCGNDNWMNPVDEIENWG